MMCRNCKSDIPDELHFVFCGYCGERLIKERKKKDAIRVPKARQRGQRWYLELRREGVTVIEGTEAEAIARATAIRAGFIEAKAKHPPLTLRQALNNYIAERSNALSPSTVRGYEGIVRNAFPDIMDTDIYGIKNWQAVVNREAGRVKAKTLQNEWRFIKTVLDKNKVEYDVSTLPQVIKNELPWLDYEQIKTFLNAIHGDECELGALFALHGLRRSELLALTPEKIQGGKILVHGSAVVGADNKLVAKAENKNTSSRREVDIMIPRLEELLKEDHTPAGTPYIKFNVNTLRAKINRVCAQNGLPEVGVHGLRRSFASLAYHLGWSERQTMKTGGWSDFTTVHSIYVKLAEADEKADIDVMKEFYK